jgi:hypothetical protein
MSVYGTNEILDDGGCYAMDVYDSMFHQKPVEHMEHQFWFFQALTQGTFVA